MKVTAIDDDVTIFLPQDKLVITNPKDPGKTEKELYQIIDKIEKKYHVKLNGNHEIILYVNKNYGIIITIKSLEIDFLHYFNDIFNFDFIVKNNSPFLYKINDYFYVDTFLKEKNVYYYDSTFYIEIKNTISMVSKMLLLENSEIVFDEDLVKTIMNKGFRL